MRYIVDGDQMAELQTFPFICGLCLPCIPLSLAVGLYLGDPWVVPACFVAAAFLATVIYALYRAELARNLALVESDRK